MIRTPSGAALAALLLIACGGGSSPTGSSNGNNGGTSGPAPVASITVTLATTSLQLGAGTSASALLRDASGTTLTGRDVTWSSSNTSVATISTSGAITTLAIGTTTIAATSEGKSGSAQLTVNPPPVTQVVLTGALRVKVGDSYPYSVTARLADGTVVQRPVTWSLLNPASGIISQGGVLTPLVSGSIGIITTIDGVQWVGSTTGYDWTALSSSSLIGAALPADVAITNFLGTAEYPNLLVACTSAGTFAVGVGFSGIITANGSVVYSGDQGVPISQAWLESSPNFNTLTYPGLSNALQKTFATTLATNHLLTFAFGEYLNGVHSTQWRLTGMSAAIAPLLAACPGNSLLAQGSTVIDDPGAVLAPFAPPASGTAARRGARGAAGPTASLMPLLQPTLRAVGELVMHRVGP